MKVRITTTMNVNIRKGPGMIYDYKSKALAGSTFTATGASKDDTGTLWYKVDDGWICGNYVTLDKSKQAADLHRANRLKTAAGEEGETTEVTDSSTEHVATYTPPDIGSISDVANITSQSDVLLGKRMFGVPYQYLPTTDIRLSNTGAGDKELGINFTEMVSELPILSVVPGVPMFMPDISADQKTGMVQQLFDKVKEVQQVPQRMIGMAADSKDQELRYFSFKEDFTTFVRYFNTLCQMNAVMMGIGNEYVPGAPQIDDFKFAYFDWSKYTLSIAMAGRLSANGLNTKGAETGGSTSIRDELGGMAQSVKDGIGRIMGSDKNAAETAVDMYDSAVEPYYTDFVVSPNINYSETFGNSVKDSAMAGMFSQMSEMTKELQFILNTSQIVSEETVNQSKQAAMDTLTKGAGMLGGSTFVNRFLKGASSVLSGTNIVFPQIWNSSSYARNYTIEIPLYTPYGNLTNIFMDILVPIWFWIAISAPHQASVNSYSAPFMLKCHVPGIFSIDMGMVESLNITKGVNNEWSVDGYPLAVTLQISIVDLYQSFFISRINGVSLTDAYNMMMNSSLIDYVSVQSGIDMKRAEWDKKLDVAAALAANAGHDLFHHPAAAIKESQATAIRDMSAIGRVGAGLITEAGRGFGDVGNIFSRI